MYVAVHDDHHYCGGTASGCSYLQNQAPWIPYSFMGSIAESKLKGYSYHTSIKYGYGPGVRQSLILYDWGWAHSHSLTYSY